MTDPISNEAIQRVAESASETSGPQPIEIDVQDQSRFEEALNGAESKEDAQQQPQQEYQTQSADESADVTLGDAILDGIEKMKSSHDERAGRIEKQLTDSSKEEMTVQDCVKLQFEVMQMGLEQELTGKIADKSGQGVQTLFKNQ